jgi:hypothetical protein
LIGVNILRLPVKVQVYSKLDIDFMLKMKKEEQEFLFFLIYEREENFLYPLLSKHYGRRVDKMLVVYDLKNTSLLKIYYKLLPILKLGTNICKKYYPGTLYKIIVFNAGKFLENNNAQVFFVKQFGIYQNPGSTRRPNSK